MHRSGVRKYALVHNVQVTDASIRLLAVGFVAGVVAWLTLAARFSGGSVTIATVGLLDPCLYGCLTGIATSGVVTVILSLALPAN